MKTNFRILTAVLFSTIVFLTSCTPPAQGLYVKVTSGNKADVFIITAMSNTAYSIRYYKNRPSNDLNINSPDYTGSSIYNNEQLTFKTKQLIFLEKEFILNITSDGLFYENEFYKRGN